MSPGTEGGLKEWTDTVGAHLCLSRDTENVLRGSDPSWLCDSEWITHCPCDTVCTSLVTAAVLGGVGRVDVKGMRFPAAEWPIVYDEQAKTAGAWLGGDIGGATGGG